MSRRRRREAPSGGLVVWKPSGISSRAAVNQVERALGWRGLGHTGTLDPLAAGILILLGGNARKFQDFLMAARKVYDARIALGHGSLSGDSEGPLYCVWPRPAMPTAERIREALEEFRGEISQIPPRLSAVRVDGQRAYRRVRSGEDVALEPRRVRVHEIELLDWQPPVLRVRVESGPGFYVRTFADDLGARVECGGFLASLRRTHAGGFAEEDATPLERVSRDEWRSLEELLVRAPRADVDDAARELLARGQRVRSPSAPRGPVVVWCADRVYGLAEAFGGTLQPRRWLAARRASS